MVREQAKFGKWVVATFGAAVVAACSAGAAEPDTDELGSAIVGGQETPTCGWPTTVAFHADLGGGVGAGCTATLINPKMISLAAHCIEEGTNFRISFGDTDDDGNRSPKVVSLTKCTPRP